MYVLVTQLETFPVHVRDQSHPCRWACVKTRQCCSRCVSVECQRPVQQVQNSCGKIIVTPNQAVLTTNDDRPTRKIPC